MKATATALLLLSVILLPSPAVAQHPLEYLHGTWEGSGTTSGMSSLQRATWAPALGGRFTTLQIHNRMQGENGREFVFEGTGYYQQSADAGALTGVWIDSQGDVLALSARLEDRVLIVRWGTAGTKEGRSEYRLQPDGKLEIVDSIKTDSGEWREFGRAILVRE